MYKTASDVVIFLLVTSFLILVMAGFIVTILFLYRKRQLLFIKEIEEIKSEYEKASLSARLEIQEETFKNISREIHDNINLSLTYAKLNLNGSDPRDSAKINTAIEHITRAISDLTKISRGMNSDIILEYGLMSALKEEISNLKKLECFNIRFLICGEPVFLDAQREIFVFRIIQEAFNNIIKHALATEIILELNYNDVLNVIVEDNGVGFRGNWVDGQPQYISSGLINMKKRAELMGGQIVIESNIGKGTRLMLDIPYH